MADNYKAKVSSIGTFLYKNSRIAEDLTGEMDHATIQYDVYIPNVENIMSLNTFNVAYANNDVNQERPYYVKIFRDSEYTDTTYPNATYSSSEKLHFGDNKITFFSLDNSENKIGIRDTVTDPGLKYTSCPFDPERYGLAAPFTVGGSYGGSAYQFGYVPDIQGSDTFYFGGYDVLKTMVDGEGVEGLKPIRNDSLDSYIIPYNIGINVGYNGPNMLSTKDGEVECSIGFPNYSSNVPRTFNTQSFTYNGVSYKTACYTNRNSFNIKGRKTIDNTIVNTSVYNMCLTPGYSPVSNFTWLYYALNNSDRIISYAFLCDNNGDIWILTLSQMYWQEGNLSYYPGRSVAYMLLTKVDNLPTNLPTENRIGRNTFPDLDLNTTIDMQATFKSMLKLQTYGYDDGGPDIVGPGDPYGEIDNVDDVVGGKDINTEKDLESIDTAPNTDYDRFSLATGFFGSYVLETKDLVRYTKTLSQLYKHSNDILAGEACQAMANRIENSVTSLLMLPIEIPSDDYSNTVFALGNTGIMGDGTWSEYKNGDNYASAHYLTKFTKIYNVSLGTINHNYDNFLDFAPYSTASLFIPYIGKVELPINIIQSTSNDQRPLSLQFRINYTSGDFVVILICKIDGKDIPISHWNGNCARTVKVAVNDDSEAIRAGANRLVSMFTASMSIGSMQSPMSGSVSANTQTWQSVDPMKYGSPTSEKQHNYATQNMNVRAPSMPSSVTTSQHLIGNGSVSGELGFLGNQKIVLTIERPVWWRPYDYGDFMGYPTKKIAKLSSVSGFAKVTDIHVRCSATSDEKEEISSLLSQGVIF